jgi:translation initiation factor 2B subunit (eIF-2B alpha/beta/delta family)
MKLKRDIVSLFNNKTEGSSAILNKLNNIVKKEFKDKEYLLFLIKESQKHFDTFSNILNYLQDIRKELSNDEALLKLINYYSEYEKIVQNKIFENGKKYFLNVSKVITISNSFTVFSFLNKLNSLNSNLEVIIAESRPKNEGKVLAKKLIERGIPIEFITDFSTAYFIQKADVAVIGADKVLSNGNIVNKTGSLALAILCSYYNKPLYVITSKSKITDESSYSHEDKDPTELWRYSHKILKVKNYYFEEIEKDLITRIITD